jgi:protein-disulfide isomerase
MAKRQRPNAISRPTQGARQTNWVVIGGIVGAGMLFLVALLVWATREASPKTLADYCEDNPGRCIIEGNPDAPVTIVEISDYACSVCRIFNTGTAQTLHEEYVATGEVRWIIFPFALWLTSVPAAAASMCAADQGAELFAEMHYNLFSLQDLNSDFSRENLLAVATRSGLEMSSFTSCLDNRTYVNIAETNTREARLLGVSSTPTFFINGVRYAGNAPISTFRQRIEAASRGQ